MLAELSLLTQALGLGMQAWGQFQEGQSAAEAALYNAAIARQQADLTRQGAAITMARSRKKAKSFISSQEAAYAKAGVRPEGSPLEVMADSAAELELDILMQDFNSQVEAGRLESQAKLETMAAKDYKRASVMRPMTTLLTQGTTLINDYATPKTSKKVK